MDVKKCIEKRAATIQHHEKLEYSPKDPFSPQSPEWKKEAEIARADGRELIPLSARPVAILGDGEVMFVDACAKMIFNAATQLVAQFAPDEKDKPFERGSVAAVRKIAADGLEQEDGIPYLLLDTRVFNAANNLFLSAGLMIVSTDLSEPASAAKKFSLVLGK